MTATLLSPDAPRHEETSNPKTAANGTSRTRHRLRRIVATSARHPIPDARQGAASPGQAYPSPRFEPGVGVSEGHVSGSEQGDHRQVQIAGYAECAYEIAGSDNWMNEAYFAKREMRPLFVDELAVHPEHQGIGIGTFILEQLEHLARLRGCTHLVLEVAENNANALRFYRSRGFYKFDAAVFLAMKVSSDAELLPPRKLPKQRTPPAPAPPGDQPAPSNQAVNRPCGRTR
jgi:ribosomal protein S18 acetylase RimI-like enzyme